MKNLMAFLLISITSTAWTETSINITGGSTGKAMVISSHLFLDHTFSEGDFTATSLSDEWMDAFYQLEDRVSTARFAPVELRNLMRNTAFDEMFLFLSYSPYLDQTAIIAVPHNLAIESDEIREIFEEKYDMEIIPIEELINNGVLGKNF